MTGWHYCLCEPAIVLAAWVEIDENGGVLSVLNGEWYSYVVLPAGNQAMTGECPHDFDEREAAVYTLCPICMRAEIEQLNRYAERLGANAERDANEIERLQAGLTDIASGTCSASGAAAIAKDVLRGKTREEWS